MATHYHEVGHTKPVLGASYVRSLRFNYSWTRYKLRSFNETTGMATLVRSHYTVFVSLSDLSHWHMVER